MTQTNSICECYQSLNFGLLTRKFNLIVEAHEPINSDDDHLLESIASALGRERNELATAFEAHKFDVQFKNLASIELGNNFINNQSVVSKSYLARLGVITEYFQIKIYVFCDLLSLFNVHNGSQVFLMSPTFESDPASALSLILTEGFAVHQAVLMQQPIITNLKIIKYEQNEPYVEIELAQINDEFLGNEIDFVDITDGSEHLERDDLGELIYEQEVQDHDLQAEVRDEDMTIDEFLIINFEGNNSERICESTYTSRNKLDFKASTVSSENFQIQRTFDIDGFFGFLDINQFKNCLKCAIKFNIYTSKAGPRTMKNIRSMLQLQNSSPLYCFNLAKIDLPLGGIDILVMFLPNRGFNESILESIMQESANFARTLPCQTELDHRNTCRSFQEAIAHLSTNRSSTKSFCKAETEIYSRNVGTCYLSHFQTKVLERINNYNIGGEVKIYFKSIGSKSALRCSSVMQSIAKIKSFGDALELELLDPKLTFVDFCVAATAKSAGVIGKVKYHFINY